MSRRFFLVPLRVAGCSVGPSVGRPSRGGRRVGSILLAPVWCLLLWSAMAPTMASGAEGSDPLIDLHQSVVEADQRYNRAARERDRESFLQLLHEDTVFLAGELHSGRLAVAAIWQPLFDGKYNFRYQGEELDAGVAGSGEWAWTIGKVETSFQRPGAESPEVTPSHYLHVWTRTAGGSGESQTGPDANWRLAYASTLVVHPTLGAARDPRSGLMTAWPELADQIGAEITIHWTPEVTVRAGSGELAYTFGGYETTFGAAAPIRGKGHFLAIWQKDDRGHWQLAAEGFTPPGIHGQE